MRRRKRRTWLSEFGNDSHFVNVAISHDKVNAMRVPPLKMEQLPDDVEIAPSLVPDVAPKHETTIFRLKINAVVVREKQRGVLVANETGCDIEKL
jgi:hypothetical protein